MLSPLSLQRALGRLNLLWTAPLLWFIAYVIMGYRCHERLALRKKMRAWIDEADGRPLIICANHLTKVDSVLLVLFLFSFWQIFFEFRLLPWNIPEADHIRFNPFYKVFCYLGKCIPIHRGGPARQKARTMAKITALLHEGEYLCIFPEGRRARSGSINVNEAVYGVGRLLMREPNCLVACIYLRADRGEGFGDFPRRASHFFWDADLISPATHLQGMRGARELTQQIMERLKSMEEKYFVLYPSDHKQKDTARAWQRYCRQG